MKTFIVAFIFILLYILIIDLFKITISLKNKLTNYFQKKIKNKPKK
jgi:hypothetical protein